MTPRSWVRPSRDPVRNDPSGGSGAERQNYALRNGVCGVPDIGAGVSVLALRSRWHGQAACRQSEIEIALQRAQEVQDQ